MNRFLIPTPVATTAFRSPLFPAASVRSLAVAALSVLLLFIAIFSSTSAWAAQSDWAETPQAKARLLVAAIEQQGDQRTLKAGLEIQMDEGWKTYWRTPGAAGIPPVVKATSDNIDSIQLHYPAPLRLDFQGLQLYGYEKKIIFPLDITLKPTADNSNLALDARILICRELCIPVSFKPEIPAADLPDLNQAASGVLDADAAFMINQFASRIPRSAEQAGLKPASIQLDSQQKLLEIQLQLPAKMQLLDLFPELSPEPELDAPIIAAPTALESTSIQNSDQLWRAQFPIQRKRLPSPEEAANLVIRTSQGDFELPLNWQQTDAALTRLQGTPVSGYKGSAALGETGSAPSLWLMLLMALTGGLILNLMPCVLPVLSIKVLHLIKHSELSRTQVRSSFIATAAGIISSFLLLAGILIALKASGQAIGWGIQFQQPLFIAALALIVVIFAGNLWGLFEFRLPALFSTLGNGQNSSESNSHSLTSSFGQGALATLLATPCSAPFLGTAIGFAFSQDNVTLLLIFFALGVGLALPYLLMTLKPEWVYKLPKPGRWMLTLKRVLGIGLLLTAGWLFWVLSDLVVMTGVIAVASLGLLWWLLVKRHRLIWLLPVLALALIPFFPQAESRDFALAANADSEDQLNWVAFEPDRIPQYVAENKVVFVDITARWCVTCVANKVAVINTPEIQQALSAEGVLPMQGDWTRPDATISDFLNRHQRFGIPFNAVYGPGAPEGILLSEILTKDALLDALKKAQGQYNQDH
ncbi:protein-disulfide reductase DsbD family protein [Oceanospirillum sanctuarii]|uniref:protein-disulfide reductase DsbD family protein n=1 Tax=Oceanospirillum sanctuarii TaxID=1434821 RepID=UPI000A3905B2|nr:protein-disulfide reductase DsbD domain-containing protein [Oceanospirillum sanctuarii]